MNETVKHIKQIAKQAGYNTRVIKKYGVWLIEFEYDGIQLRGLKKFIDQLPEGSILTTNNGCFAINTRIPIK
jgi:predicted solute-binding protein